MRANRGPLLALLVVLSVIGFIAWRLVDGFFLSPARVAAEHEGQRAYFESLVEIVPNAHASGCVGEKGLYPVRVLRHPVSLNELERGSGWEAGEVGRYPSHFGPENGPLGDTVEYQVRFLKLRVWVATGSYKRPTKYGRKLTGAWTPDSDRGEFKISFLEFHEDTTGGDWETVGLFPQNWSHTCTQ